VPFEPKTDSKEFEVSNPGHGAGASGSAASEPADLTIRVWRQDSGAGSITWVSDSMLVYMMADLVAASQGRTAVELPNALCAHFENSSQALVAAKRIQTAILEFVACRPGDYIGAAVLVHGTANGGFSQGMAQSALRLAEPGQIILSEQVARRLQPFPGLELRDVPALTTGGNEHAGLSELVWTSPEKLAALRSSASAAPATNLGAPVGATMIVNAPLAPRHDSPKTAARTVGKDDGKASETVYGPVRTQEGGFQEALADFEEHSSFLTGSRILIVAIAIVLVAVGLAWFHPWSSTKRTPVVNTPPSGTETLGTTNSASDSGTTTETPVTVTHEPEPPKQPKKPVVEKKKKPDVVVIHNFEGNSTYDGMTQNDIPTLLGWARSDQGNGRYTKAAQEYRVILAMQPNNADAKEGLRKIQIAQEGNK